MTSDEVKAAIERLKKYDKDDYSVDAFMCRFMGGKGWLVSELRDTLVDLLRQADPDTHMELPKDYNGETVRIGDKVEQLYNGRWSEPFEIVELRLWPSGWIARGENGATVITETCRHYHKPTVEDVLKHVISGVVEYANEHRDKEAISAYINEAAAVYAAKIRETMADD